MASIMIIFRFLSVALLSSFGVAHKIPQYANFPRQAISNATSAHSTSFSISSITVGTANITSSSSWSTSASSSSSSTNGTCPITYASDYPVEYATFTAPCEAKSASASGNYWEYADKCLGEWCRAEFSSAIQSYVSASITKITTTTRTWYQGFYGTGSLSTVIVTQSYWTQTYTYNVAPPKAVTPKAPCCSKCTLSAQTIHLFFWPNSATAAPTVTGLPPNATATVTGLPENGSGLYVDDSGFTFTSPSVYIGFTSLGAHDVCGPVGEVSCPSFL
ncbi:hypothetical protein K469DRAFT_25913 [Zopfia rhizophila CBS 207.26]|uniref:Lytic polysaccharide monooxygenase n=1 Tax=Zopfia rhizophila CBS 207.26 TaxID=1314779 RepID=A0A6A6EHA6_9PEZI|nr:hypothetical protein K469DRAFT_25913 [Zopfia rhizophila CBS 207.26]